MLMHAACDCPSNARTLQVFPHTNAWKRVSYGAQPCRAPVSLGMKSKRLWPTREFGGLHVEKSWAKERDSHLQVAIALFWLATIEWWFFERVSSIFWISCSGHTSMHRFKRSYLHPQPFCSDFSSETRYTSGRMNQELSFPAQTAEICSNLLLCFMSRRSLPQILFVLSCFPCASTDFLEWYARNALDDVTALATDGQLWAAEQTLGRYGAVLELSLGSVLHLYAADLQRELGSKRRAVGALRECIRKDLDSDDTCKLELAWELRHTAEASRILDSVRQESQQRHFVDAWISRRRNGRISPLQLRHLAWLQGTYVRRVLEESPDADIATAEPLSFADFSNALEVFYEVVSASTSDAKVSDSPLFAKWEGFVGHDFRAKFCGQLKLLEDWEESSIESVGTGGSRSARLRSSQTIMLVQPGMLPTEALGEEEWRTFGPLFGELLDRLCQRLGLPAEILRSMLEVQVGVVGRVRLPTRFSFGIDRSLTHLMIAAASTSASAFDVVRYGPGDFYKLHDDSGPWQGDVAQEYLRLGSAFVYLQAPDGQQTSAGTFFPVLFTDSSSAIEAKTVEDNRSPECRDKDSANGFYVAPLPGRAVFWVNYKPKSLQVDLRVRHRGCPVEQSAEREKWGLNIWLRLTPEAAVRLLRWDLTRDVATLN
eukprot:scaffold1659_cov255-Pinguiococcus_pyrenoidosus.AAC.3